jgi:hypothetical protein
MAGEIIKGSIKAYAPDGLDTNIFGKYSFDGTQKPISATYSGGLYALQVFDETNRIDQETILYPSVNKISGGSNSGNSWAANDYPFQADTTTTTFASVDSVLASALTNINSQGYTYINHSIVPMGTLGTACLLTVVYTTHP